MVSMMSVTATEMSALESGRALMVAEPLEFDTCTIIFGVGSLCLGVLWRRSQMGDWGRSQFWPKGCW